MKFMDIDIDFDDRAPALENLACIFAADKDRRKHVSGVYFQDIPVDPFDEMAVWDHKTADQKGYFKVDLLHNHIYHGVQSEAHLVGLLTTEPPWEVFENPDIVSQLAHIGNYFDVIKSIRPRSIEDLAVCIALIRPGKKHLIGRPRSEIDQEIWIKTEKYYFKKSHSYSYAAAIVVQLNLLVEEATA